VSTPPRNAGIEAPDPSFLRRILPFFVLIPVLLFFWLGFGAVFPNGFRREEPREHEGMLSIPDNRRDKARWSSAETMREDAATAGQGYARVTNTCVAASPEVWRAIEQARRSAASKNAHGTALWVRMIAETRFGEWPCLARGRGKHPLGMQVRIHRILSVKPLGCDPLVFERNGLHCPLVVSPESLKLDDADGTYYPAAARHAGAEGSTKVRLLVAGAGEVLSCEVVQSSGNADLDNGTCPMLRANPELIGKKGRTKGLATGVREVTQKVTWRLGR